MLTKGLFATLLAFTSHASASAGSLDKRSFSISRSTPQKTYHDGPAAMRKAYLKHGMELPEALQKRQLPPPSPPGSAAQPTATASEIAVTEQNDLEYLSPVDIGGTLMQLDFDTGSSDLWVFSERLPAQQRNGHAFYALSNTTGQVQDGLSWKIAYGDGSGASGIVFADKVTIGEVTATRQAVEAATSISAEFAKEHSDGLLGLGFGNTNTIKPTKQPTFFENIKTSLKQPLFTVSLKKNATGVYDFGYIDQAKYIEPLQYIPINTTRGYWEYTTTGFQVGNGPMVQKTFQSIADTGTTLMLLPPTAVQAYYAQVKDASNNVTEGGYVFPCNSLLPDLTVQMIGNVSAVIPGTFMNRSVSQTPGSTSCYGGIQQGSETLSIWGDVFLKSQFAVFDGRDPPRIGFARQAVDWNTHMPPSLFNKTDATVASAAAAAAPVASAAPLVQPPLNWMSFFLDLAKRYGIVPDVKGNGLIAKRKRFMVGRWKHIVANA